jgi:fucose 4-O-acetylase-like acetyltransferase
MPLFFFISGFLLFYTKIRKNSNYLSIIKTRVPRIVYPYFFITFAVYLFKIVFSSYINRPVEFSLSFFINCFIYPETNPWANLWFLNVVLIFFLCYPLLKLSLKNFYTILTTFIICILINIFIPKDISFLDLSSVGQYLIFFYGGILFSKYDLQKYMKKFIVILISLSIFILSVIFEFPKIIFSFSGILVSIYFANVCSNFIPNLFSSFRKYYYQIYLIGTFFQGIVLLLYETINIENLFIPLSLLSILCGLYIPVLISKIIKRINWKPLLNIFGF